jgi:predicted TIM-barrel enzyme
VRQTITTSLAGALVFAVVLAGGAILSGGVATADPKQDEQFLSQLGYEDIPAVQNEPTLVAVAHRDCRELDSGMPFDDVVDEMREKSFDANPIERLLPQARVTRTITRFITAAVDVYCPSNQGKLPQ